MVMPNHAIGREEPRLALLLRQRLIYLDDSSGLDDPDGLPRPAGPKDLEVRFAGDAQPEVDVNPSARGIPASRVHLLPLPARTHARAYNHTINRVCIQDGIQETHAFLVAP